MINVEKPILIKNLLLMLLFLRLCVCVFIINFLILPIFPKIGIVLFYGFFLLYFPLAFGTLPFAFLPRCPYCNGPILITPYNGCSSNFHRPNGMYQRLFGHLARTLISKELSCVRCGGVSTLS